MFEVLPFTRSGSSVGFGDQGRLGEVSILEGLSKGCGLDPEAHGS